MATDTLVLFSGGRDSFLVACDCVARGERVALLSFSCGCLMGEQNLAHTASRLAHRYEGRVKYEGLYNLYSVLQNVNRWWATASSSSIASECPLSDTAQLSCLHCHTAIWIAAIAYGTAKGYHKICAGWRQSDRVCTGSLLYRKAIEHVAERFHVVADFPFWDMEPADGSWEAYRNKEMTRFGFYPKVLEPQCMYRSAPTSHIKDIASELDSYFHARLKPVMIQQIPELRESFRSVGLKAPTVMPEEYTVPPESRGLY